VRARPYGTDKKLKRLKEGAAVTVVGRAKNAAGIPWYMLDDGNWIYRPRLAETKPG